jgi:hypothetical protein
MMMMMMLVMVMMMMMVMVMMMLMTHDDCKCGATSGLRVGANMFKLLERCIYIYIIVIII